MVLIELPFQSCSVLILVAVKITCERGRIPLILKCMRVFFWHYCTTEREKHIFPQNMQIKLFGNQSWSLHQVFQVYGVTEIKSIHPLRSRFQDNLVDFCCISVQMLA